MPFRGRQAVENPKRRCTMSARTGTEDKTRRRAASPLQRGEHSHAKRKGRKGFRFMRAIGIHDEEPTTSNLILLKYYFGHFWRDKEICSGMPTYTNATGHVESLKKDSLLQQSRIPLARLIGTKTCSGMR